MKAPLNNHWLIVACVTSGTLTLLCGPWPALGQERFKPLPERPGVAARHPGDEGLERDARVLFLEDFETGRIRELADRWGKRNSAGEPELFARLSAELAWKPVASDPQEGPSFHALKSQNELRPTSFVV